MGAHARRTAATSGDEWTQVSELYRACKYGDVRGVETALARHPPIDAVDGVGRTCLHEAAEGGFAEIVKALLSRGAFPGIKDKV